MLSFNFVDTFFDKLLPVRGKGSSLVKINTTQNLMSHRNDIFQSLTHEYHKDLMERDWIFSEYQASNPDVVLNSLFPWMMGNNVQRHIPKLAFSPHLTAIVQSSLRFILDQSEMLECIKCSNFQSNMLCDAAYASSVTRQAKIAQHISCASESSSAIVIESNSHIPISAGKILQVNKSFTSSSKIKMDKNNQSMSGNNCNLSVQLANRKAKELHKRSKKRRRRQKRVHVDCHSSVLKLAHGSETASAVGNSHSKVLDHSDKLVSPTRTKGKDLDFMLDIVHLKNGDANVVELLLPNVSSFVVSVTNTSDEDSDWDASTETDWFPESNEFELSGLFMTNLSTTKTDLLSGSDAVPGCSIVAFCNDDFDELNELQAVLCEVNKKWEEDTKEIDKIPKLPSKVSFAPDDELVEVMPVEIYERKGEWEMYATERIRFRRRIDKLEKVLSPCLSEAHRLKIYQQFHQSQL